MPDDTRRGMASPSMTHIDESDRAQAQSVYHAAFVDRLTPVQINKYSRHTLTPGLSPALVGLLHILTLGAFTVIYFGLKHSRLPRVEKQDWGAWRAIGPMCVPILNVLWSYLFWFGLARRLAFQYWIRGLAAPTCLGPALITGTILGTILALVLGDTGIVFLLITEAVDFGSAITLIVGFSYVISWFFVGGIPAPFFQRVVNDLAAIERAGSGFDAGSRVLRTDSQPFAELPKRRSRVPGWARRLFRKAADAVYLYVILNSFERHKELGRREKVWMSDPEAAEREGWLFPDVKASRRETNSE